MDDLERNRLTPPADPEKEALPPEIFAEALEPNNAAANPIASSKPSFARTAQRAFIKYNIESRGIQRVPANERQSKTKREFLHILQFWMSYNLTAILITLGMLGPSVYYLSFRDCALLSVFGSIVGAVPAAYVATFGPRSGNRTMILTRYITGWYPSKLIVLLTLAIYLGYILIDTVIAGQILSAVSSKGHLSVIVGIVIVSVITWSLSTFGIGIFHIYEKYAWLPQAVVTAILAGVAGPRFGVNMSQPIVGAENVVSGNRLSFFGLCLASQITYAQGAADYFVYFPPATSRAKVFTAALAGLALSSAFTLLVGIGLGSGASFNQDWAQALETSQGALIVEALRPLGRFGDFCSVIIALGLIGNLVPTNYSTGVDCQALGHHFEQVPRLVWNTAGIIVPMICAIVGREYLADIFTNFVSLMGYWVSIWIAIFVEEHLLVRRRMGLGWDWEIWNDRKRLPIGIAALFSFLVGWAGAVLSMAQVWYVGPLATLISPSGGDMGNYVGAACAGIVYPFLRLLELRTFGR